MDNQLEVKELRTITIVGVGLLGGSLGMALRAVELPCRRIGLVRRPHRARQALACDAVDEATTDPRRGLAEADLVVIATPIGAFREVMKIISQYGPHGAIVTDLGSVKRSPEAWAKRLLRSDLRFVGSHPMAGGERAGVEFARADLFEGAVCFICPGSRSEPQATRLVEHIWRAAGCLTLKTSPARHDALVAKISHVPHLVAAALIHSVRQDDWLDLAGPGLRDATRIASGNPQMWREIVSENRDEIVKALDNMIRQMQSVRATIERGDFARLSRWLAKAAQRRDAWLERLLKRGNQDA